MLQGRRARAASKAVRRNGWTEAGLTWLPGVDPDPFGHDEVESALTSTRRKVNEQHPASPRSRIFRSDDVHPGERVVIRRVIDGQHSDVIGHVVDLNEKERWWCARRPSAASSRPRPGLEVRLHALRSTVVPAPTAGAQFGDPGHRGGLFGGLPRHRAHLGQRWAVVAASWRWHYGAFHPAAPLGRSAVFTPVPVAEIQAFYARHNLPPKVLIPERIGKQAEQMAKDHGWELDPEIIVMTRELTDLPTPDERAEFRIDEQPDRAWLGLYHFRGKPLPEHAEPASRASSARWGFSAAWSMRQARPSQLPAARLPPQAAGSIWGIPRRGCARFPTPRFRDPIRHPHVVLGRCLRCDHRVSPGHRQ